VSSGISLATLVEAPSLNLAVRAGAGGLDACVSWAHICEAEDPSLWLERGDLLVAFGFGFSKSASGQVQYVRRLVRRRVAGLFLGPQVNLCRETVREADEQAFPIATIPADVPFSAITRMVADAQGDTAQRRLLTHVRIFDTLRLRTERSASLQEMFGRLGELCGCDLHVMAFNGTSAFSGLPPAPPEVITPAVIEGTQAGRVVGVESGSAVPILIDSKPAAILVAIERAGGDFAGVTALRHIATIAAVELAALYRERDAERRDGGLLLLELLAGSLSPSRGAQRTRELGLDPDDGLVLAGCRHVSDDIDVSALYHRLVDEGVPCLMLERELVYVVLQARTDALDRVAESDGLVVGYSAPLTDMAAIPLARHQARWAVERAAALGRSARFDGDDRCFWLPADVASLRRLASDILGPVIAYDVEHKTELLSSLIAYFVHNRKLAEASEELFVHKRTLAYRLKKVQELTGRRLSDVSDASQLWLGTQALMVAGTFPDEADRGRQETTDGWGSMINNLRRIEAKSV
jgi:purine catabolism regulator